jgi:hypothetical protein
LESFFSKLDIKFCETVKKLEQSLKKYYVVFCLQNGRRDRCREFFEQFSEDLAKDKEWKDWFGEYREKLVIILLVVVPFVNNPEQIPELEPYFNKRWVEMLSISLHNFNCVDVSE